MSGMPLGSGKHGTFVSSALRSSEVGGLPRPHHARGMALAVEEFIPLTIAITRVEPDATLPGFNIW